MENLQHLDKIRSSGENRKRLHNSGRLSPRALFGNLISKKALKDEDAKSNSKTTLGWKPPLKIELNESNDTCPTFYNDNTTQKFYCSQQSVRDSCPLQKHSFSQEGESNFSNLKENIYFKEGVKLKENEESDAESFTGNSEETVLYEEFSDKKQFIDFQEDVQDHDISLDDSSNDDNSENQESDTNYEDGNVNTTDVVQRQALIEDPKFFHVKNESPIRTTTNYNIIHPPNPPVEKSFEEPIFDSQHKDTDMMYKKDLSAYCEFNENECLDKRDNSPKNQIELNEHSKIISTECNNIKSNIPSQDSLKEEIDKEMNIFNDIKSAKKEIDDAFDLAVTNSQFLQLERQVGKSCSNNIETKDSNNISLNNNIEIIKRCSSSMTVQTEWQKNILKSLIRDINELNKAVLNATETIKSARRGNASIK